MNNFLNIGGKDLLKKTLIMASFPQAIPVVLLNELAEQYDSPHRRKKNISDLSKDNVEPGVGSLIYCELFKMEHSGIYMGDHRIAQLNGRHFHRKSNDAWLWYFYSCKRRWTADYVLPCKRKCQTGHWTNTKIQFNFKQLSSILFRLYYRRVRK